MPRNFPTEFQRRTLWSALTGVAIVIIGSLGVGFVLLLGKVLAYLQPVLVPLAVAGILAYLLNPLVEKLEEKGMTRLRAIIYVFTLAIVLCALAISLVLPSVVRQTGELIEKREELAENLVRDLRTTPWIRPLLNQALSRHENYEAATTEEPSADLPHDQSSFRDWLEAYPE